MSKLLTKQLAKAQRNLREQAKRVKARQALLRKPHIKQIWETIPMSMRKGTSVSVSDFTDSIYFSIPLDGLTSLKDDPRLMSVLERFTGSEWHASTSDWTGGDTPNRDFTFHQFIKEPGQDAFNIYVTVAAYVKGDSPSCKIETRLRTETVTKEERIIVCA